MVEIRYRHQHYRVTAERAPFCEHIMLHFVSVPPLITGMHVYTSRHRRAFCRGCYLRDPLPAALRRRRKIQQLLLNVGCVEQQLLQVVAEGL